MLGQHSHCAVDCRAQSQPIRFLSDSDGEPHAPKDPFGEKRRIDHASRSKYAEDIRGTEDLETGRKVVAFSIHFPDAEGTNVWLEMELRAILR